MPFDAGSKIFRKLHLYWHAMELQMYSEGWAGRVTSNSVRTLSR